MFRDARNELEPGESELISINQISTRHRNNYRQVDEEIEMIDRVVFAVLRNLRFKI